MADALTKACRREVEHYVRDLLATAPLVADAIGRLPSMPPTLSSSIAKPCNTV